jgi:surface polysaccharide O-acyltransferase-like enzyme
MTQDGTSRKNLFYVDLIKSYAIIMVVLLHAAAKPMLNFSTISPSAWWVSNLLFSFAHQGVPLFVMVSGLLLLDPKIDEPLSVFFRKRIQKVIIPLFFWSVFYYVWRISFKDETLSAYQAGRLMIKGPIYYHLWFLYMILGLYLAVPILRAYMKVRSTAHDFYFLAMWLVFTGLFPFFAHATGVRIGIQNVLFNSMIGYFVLGRLLIKTRVPQKYDWLIILVVILATLFTTIGTHVFTVEAGGEYQNFFTDYRRPNIIALSICMFILLFKWQYSNFFQGGWLPILIRRFAVSSFGIYLLHPVVIELLEIGNFGLYLDAIGIHPAISLPLIVAISITVCYFIVNLIRSIPVLRSVVP